MITKTFLRLLPLAVFSVLALGACGDDDDDVAPVQDRLVANVWIDQGQFVAGQQLFPPGCNGDDELTFTSAGDVSLVLNDETGCTFSNIAFTGTYEVRGDSLFIDNGSSVEGYAITLLNGSELRYGATVQNVTGEFRYTAK